MAFTVNVPNLPGVPPVFRSAASSALTSLLTTDAYSLLTGIFGAPQWGLYFFGIPVVVADTVTRLGLEKSWQISDYPVENGGFQSYNKVYVPFRNTFRFVAGENSSNRQALLASIEAISGNLLQYDVVTPDAVYSGVNVTGFGYDRSADRGVGLLEVDVHVEEVRDNALAAFSNTLDPANAAQVGSGTVQPVTADSTITTTVLPGMN